MGNKEEKEPVFPDEPQKSLPDHGKSLEAHPLRLYYENPRIPTEKAPKHPQALVLNSLDTQLPFLFFDSPQTEFLSINCLCESPRRELQRLSSSLIQIRTDGPREERNHFFDLLHRVRLHIPFPDQPSEGHVTEGPQEEIFKNSIVNFWPKYTLFLPLFQNPV